MNVYKGDGTVVFKRNIVGVKLHTLIYAFLPLAFYRFRQASFKIWRQVAYYLGKWLILIRTSIFNFMDQNPEPVSGY